MIVFDAAAKEYDSWYDTALGKHVDDVETACAFKWIDALKASHFLDVGCGTGNFSRKLTDKGHQVTGIDISNNMLDIARNKVPEASFYEMDVYDLKFEDNTFDNVISMAAFEFIEYPDKAITELMRVVKPGGTVIIGAIHLDSPWGELYTSEAFKESVFSHAFLKTFSDFEDIYPDMLTAKDECLFTPPGAEVLDESIYEGENRGGFICLKWVKA